MTATLTLRVHKAWAIGTWMHGALGSLLALQPKLHWILPIGSFLAHAVLVTFAGLTYPVRFALYHLATIVRMARRALRLGSICDRWTRHPTEAVYPVAYGFQMKRIYTGGCPAGVVGDKGLSQWADELLVSESLASASSAIPPEFGVAVLIAPPLPYPAAIGINGDLPPEAIQGVHAAVIIPCWTSPDDRL